MHSFVVSENEKINNNDQDSDWWGGFIKFGKKNYFPNLADVPRQPGWVTKNLFPGSRSLSSCGMFPRVGEG